MKPRKEKNLKNMSNKVLVIGADGQLAFDLIKIFKSKKWTVVNARHSDLEVTDVNACNKYIDKHKPKVVINTAAFHKVGQCEQDPQKSFDVNALGALNVSKGANSIGAKVVFISTNYVFDGKKKIEYIESDTPHPLNIYGASKLLGEYLTSMANARYYIVRTSGLFGVKRSGKGHNFVSLMLEKARNGDSIKVVSDEITSVTYTPDLASKIYELISKQAPYGIYHLVNSEKCSWYSFAKEIFHLSKIPVDLKPTSSLKRPPEGFKRPLNSAMKGKIKLRPWRSALKDYLKIYGG